MTLLIKTEQCQEDTMKTSFHISRYSAAFWLWHWSYRWLPGVHMFLKKSGHQVLVSYGLCKSPAPKLRNQSRHSESFLLSCSITGHYPFSIWNDEWTCVKILSHDIIMNWIIKYRAKRDEWRFQYFITSEYLILLLDQCVTSAVFTFVTFQIQG